MPVMIKLRLSDRAATFDAVRALPGLSGLRLDERFGLVAIDPRASLYVVRAESVENMDHRRKLSPEILGAYGDTRITSM